MISFPPILGPDGRRLVQQRLIHPAVYLDTWAVRLFAEGDPPVRDRFRAALLRAGGTLVLSDLNLGDFCAFDDARHAYAAGRFVDSLAPNLFFATFSAFPVIDREIAIMVRQTDQSPAGDVDMLRLYAEAAERTGRPSVQGWFIEVHQRRARLKPRLASMAQAFLNGLQALQQRFDTEPGFRKSARRDVETSRRPRSTQALLRAIIFRLQGDRKLKVTVNDAVDVMHCVVPAAYCDFVLVDHPWCVRLTEAREWLDDAGIASPVARPFSQHDDGVSRFLESLEAWQPAETRAGSRRAGGKGRYCVGVPAEGLMGLT
jgi:hypothetical protein